ncbi:MAG: hypothetical protein LBU06_04405 [Desulfovibrio sp.]|nr:hypothetical protein [Desulfovibrio sp.]
MQIPAAGVKFFALINRKKAIYQEKMILTFIFTFVTDIFKSEAPPFTGRGAGIKSLPGWGCN